MPPLACLLLWKRCTAAAAISGNGHGLIHGSFCKLYQSMLSGPASSLCLRCQGEAWLLQKLLTSSQLTL